VLDAIESFRTSVARWLVGLALKVFPHENEERSKILRGRHERRLYDRYVAYTLMMRDQPMPFAIWKQTLNDWCYSQKRLVATDE
jgi:hypothetical protein